MESRIEALEKTMQQVQVNLNAWITQVQPDLKRSSNHKFEQMMAFMREHIDKGGESSPHDPQGKGKVPTSSLTYTDGDEAIVSTITAPKQHAQVHITTGQFGGVS